MKPLSKKAKRQTAGESLPRATAAVCINLERALLMMAALAKPARAAPVKTPSSRLLRKHPFFVGRFLAEALYREVAALRQRDPAGGLGMEA